MNIFVYCLLDPNDGQCRYVGISNNPQQRFKEHILYKQGNPYKFSWIKKLLQNHQKPILKIIEIVDENNWQVREKWWIRYFKKKNQKLTNLTLGGDGTFGIPCSEEKKKKISSSLIGHNVSEQTRKKISEKAKLIIKKNGHPMKGKKHSLKTLQKLSESHKGYIMPQSQKTNIAKALKNNVKIQKRLDVTWEIILQTAKQKTSLREASRRLNYSRSSLLNKLKKEGFKSWEQLINGKF